MCNPDSITQALANAGELEVKIVLMRRLKWSAWEVTERIQVVGKRIGREMVDRVKEEGEGEGQERGGTGGIQTA